MEHVQRSENTPEIKAPTERSINVTVMPYDFVSLMSDCSSPTQLPLTHVTAVFVSPNSSAISVTHRETVKKSKASQVQPKNPQKNISHWCVSSSLSTAMGDRSLFCLAGQHTDQSRWAEGRHIL